MAHNLPLDTLTIEEKIQVMETLWNDLCARAEGVASPAWHQSVLQQREDALQVKEEEFTDWEAAKQDCRRNPAWSRNKLK